MKLNKNDKKILTDMGYPLQDIEQIERLRYKFTIYDKNEQAKKISLDIAKEKLSKKDFLSGLGRAAFHRTSYRETTDENYKGILIVSNLFEE